ncbi:hypothetical protein C5167_050790 [Papaver somniferum]|uniref:Uncharacterized protein n=1 Tax=Papaver somniferum TaxID=3469 RepID=A0A4Y7KSE4_PAPSO|nr:hypothetical protein C5167_050790 [Papaver somniferum]
MKLIIHHSGLTEIYTSVADSPMAGTGCSGKQEWPELLGAKPDIAKETIERENSLVRARLIEQGTYRILDFNCNRVWVWTSPKDQSGPDGVVVVEIPKVG